MRIPEDGKYHITKYSLLKQYAALRVNSDSLQESDLNICSGIFTSISISCIIFFINQLHRSIKLCAMYELFVEFMNQIFFEGYLETLSTEEFNEEFNQFKLTYS